MVKKQVIKKSALVPTALISGGAGFVGSHLAEALLSNGARVIVIDNYNTGKDIHINHLLNNKSFAFFNVDINQGLPTEIESVDYIFHLAGLEEYLFSKDFINLESLMTNSLGTKNLLDLCQKSEAKFLLASTIDVYQGRMSQLDLSKYFGDSRFDQNKFSLTEAKRFAEAVVWEYYKKYDIDVRIARMPEIFGPRMNLESSGSLGSFLKDIIDNKDITVYGDGFEKEYYLYIPDAISGLLKSLFSPKTKGNIYSLIPDAPMSVLETAYMVKKLADGNVSLQFKPALTHPSLDINPIDRYNLKDLDWRPKKSFKDGIVETLQSFNYAPNENNFKPAKFIPKIASDTVSSLQDIAPTANEQPKAQISKPALDYRVGQPIREELLNIAPAPNVPSESVFSQKKTSSKFSKFFAFPRFKKPNFTKLFGSQGFAYAISGIGILLSAFIVFIAVPVGTTYFYAERGINSLQRVQTSIWKMDPSEITKEMDSANKNLTKAKTSFNKLSWLFNFTGKQKLFSSTEMALGSLTNFSQAALNLSNVIKPLENLWDVIRPDTNTTLSPEILEQTKFEIAKAKKSLSIAIADNSNVNKSLYPLKVQAKLNEYDALVKQGDVSINLLTDVINNLPQVLGSDEEKTYIIWFQNSNEIRPTGGFIGSYGVLKLEKGKLKDLVIDDIYNPDGQIDVRNISVSPPKPIADLLKEDHFYLRNSNWNPDFTKSALAFDDLYFKITGKKVDGFIAIDLSLAQNLLKVTGPVFLAAYNEEINADNLYERAQFHSDFNYQDGSTQKRSFLTILGGKLLEKLFTLQKTQVPVLLSEVEKSLNERHLIIYLMDNPLNAVLANKGWDGSLKQVSGDYLNIVNSNLGGTKANYYVKNKYSYSVNSMTRDGLLRGTLTLTYTHTGKDNSWPGGPYTNYLRVLTQDGSKLTGAKIQLDDQPEKDVFKEIIVAKESNYNSFETNFKLDPGHSLVITFAYDLPLGLSITKDFGKYSFYWQKQPGTSNDEYSFVFQPPFGMQLVGASNTISKNGELLKSTGVLNNDLDYFINLH